MSRCTVKMVAEAIVRASRNAGRKYSSSGMVLSETQKMRVDNLLRGGEYGAYIVKGDPNGWGGGDAAVTIYMEHKGGEEDCIPPLDYYGIVENVFDVAMDASNMLEGFYIEFVNPAVACVYPV
jgi:hypothetical protein